MKNNKLIQDCLAQLANNEEARERFNSLNIKARVQDGLTGEEVVFWGFVQQKGYATEWHTWNMCQQELVLLQLLSHAPDGKPVMPFLDVEAKLLYNQFTEALRVGKPFDEALELINQTYIKECYTINFPRF